MKTKKVYSIIYDCLRGDYVCYAHDYPTSEVVHPVYHSKKLRDAIGYFRHFHNVGYNRITFDAIDALLQKL